MIKLIAFMTMVIDHSAIFFFPEHEFVMRSLGALSFPLFAYFITQGLKYTKDLQLYIISLVTCACITQPFFNILFPDLHRLNDLYTLLFGLIILVLYERYGYHAFYLTLLLVLANVVSIYIFIVFAIYFLHHRPVYLLGAMTAFYLLVYHLSGAAYVLLGPAAVFLMYSRTTVPLPKIIQKYFYYVAYPGHFLIIILINSIRYPANT
ncbi:TraX family protein [uncultured Desulfobacter sp.]|uniref:TraX family protein n=1 Tax=uncultured Desulfobacter sp. TaxID=240139 RepID=UPI0029F53B08|nr:TraX family protein [uncultured Desulfobacter sp.]